MGTLRSTDDYTGIAVGSVVLGQPSVNEDGEYVWDDARIPSGVIVNGEISVDVGEDDEPVKILLYTPHDDVPEDDPEVAEQVADVWVEVDDVSVPEESDPDVFDEVEAQDAVEENDATTVSDEDAGVSE